MAEAAAVASIVGLASFGIRLTQTLYTFGSNVSSAREDANYIARHVDLYANVLDILTERIDDEEPLLSEAAFDLIEELRFQSNDVFNKIEQLLPNPKESTGDISFLQRMKWNFTKSRVALLVGELDYLRSTVHLLVTIIFTGRKIQSRKKRNAKSHRVSIVDFDNDLEKQSAKAQNALLAHHDALDNLADLAKELKSQGESSFQEIKYLSDQQLNARTEVISANATPAFAERQLSLTVYSDRVERQRSVLQHSADILQQLLQEWTMVGISSLGDCPPEQGVQSGKQPDDIAASPPSSRNTFEKRDSGYSSSLDPHQHDLRTQATSMGAKPTSTTSAISGREEQPVDNMQSSGAPPAFTPRKRPKPPPVPLPVLPGLISQVDPATGQQYYIEVVTGQTKWEFPKPGSLRGASAEHTSAPYTSASKEQIDLDGRSRLSYPQRPYKQAGEVSQEGSRAPTSTTGMDYDPLRNADKSTRNWNKPQDHGFPNEKSPNGWNQYDDISPRKPVYDPQRPRSSKRPAATKKSNTSKTKSYLDAIELGLRLVQGI